MSTVSSASPTFCKAHSRSRLPTLAAVSWSNGKPAKSGSPQDGVPPGEHQWAIAGAFEIDAVTQFLFTQQVLITLAIKVALKGQRGRRCADDGRRGKDGGSDLGGLLLGTLTAEVIEMMPGIRRTAVTGATRDRSPPAAPAVAGTTKDADTARASATRPVGRVKTQAGYACKNCAPRA